MIAAVGAVAAGLVLALAPVGPAVAATEAVTSPARGGDAGAVTAMALLERAVDASRALSYAGVVLTTSWTQAGSTSRVVDVTHVAGEGSWIRVQGSASDPGGDGFLRDVAPRPTATGVTQGPLPTGAGLELLSRWYSIRMAGEEGVAGRPAHVLEALRTDGSVAARFWLDAATGLPLRRSVFDAQGQVVRASVFLDLQLSGVQAPESLASTVTTTPLEPADPAALVAAGWHCPQVEGLSLLGARTVDLDGTGALQLTYTDGLSTVSLFAQPGTLDPDQLSGFVPAEVGGEPVYEQPGLPRRLVWAAEGRVYTVVSDAAPNAVETVVAALPHEEPVDRSWAARFDRGFDRLVSWVNPFR